MTRDLSRRHDFSQGIPGETPEKKCGSGRARLLPSRHCSTGVPPVPEERRHPCRQCVQARSPCRTALSLCHSRASGNPVPYPTHRAATSGSAGFLAGR
ncbi:MAG: hypothetical protein RDV41_16095, partial [Planctomycetota bacterium]|nr:hypothetical protein [Planctomycetota bacterium]